MCNGPLNKILTNSPVCFESREYENLKCLLLFVQCIVSFHIFFHIQ